MVNSKAYLNPIMVDSSGRNRPSVVTKIRHETPDHRRSLGWSRSFSGKDRQESQQGVAEHFQVSGLLIRTQLVNHRRLDREELEVETS